MRSHRRRSAAVAAGLLVAGLATAACGSTRASNAPVRQTGAAASAKAGPSGTVAGAPVTTPAVPPAGATAASQASDAEKDLAAIDASLKTFDTEQSTAASGLTADEGDPSK